MVAEERRILPNKLLIALGGNAIHPEGIKGTGEEQVNFALAAARSLFPLVNRVPQLVLTHGNGPGVGKVLMRQAIASKRVASMPLDICVANSQGGISYVIMQALQNILREEKVQRRVASLVCEVEVAEDDPAFAHPDKPLGYFFTAEEAKNLAVEFGWTMREDAGRGWRMVVPSPRPRKILDCEVIASLMEQGVIVITGGGGGVPVLVDGRIRGVEAVVDKDLTSALLARELGIDELVILTSVKQVKINFGSRFERGLSSLSLAELDRYAAEGHFAAGSMGPKIQAVKQFLELGGKQAVIAHLDDAYPAVLGKAGTRVSR